MVQQKKVPTDRASEQPEFGIHVNLSQRVAGIYNPSTPWRWEEERKKHLEACGPVILQSTAQQYKQRPCLSNVTATIHRLSGGLHMHTMGHVNPPNKQTNKQPHKCLGAGEMALPLGAFAALP